MVGSHLLYELVQKNEKVRAIRRQSSNFEHVRYVFSIYAKNAQKLLDRIEWIEADIRDIESLNMSFEGIRQVYHCAAMVSLDPSEKYDMIRNNQEGCANVVNVCLEKKIDKLCYVSSTSALGSAPENMMVTEDHIWSASKHRSAYSVSKFRSELEIWRGIAEGLNAVIVNPSIIIGPGDWERSSSRLFSAVWKGMKYYTEGVTGYVDILDVVSAMIRLMESDVSAERYTLSSENLSYRDILEIIAENLNKRPPRIHAGLILLSIAWRLDWMNHKITGKQRSITKDVVLSSRNKSYFSNQKITDELGLVFKPISESLKDTAKIFLDYTSGKTAMDAQS